MYAGRSRFRTLKFYRSVAWLLTGIEAFLTSAQFRWVGHVTCIDDTRLPKIAFYCELEHGTRSLGGQQKRFKDMLKSNTKDCNMQANELESLTADRSSWRPCLRSKYPSSRTTACNHCSQTCSKQDWSSTTTWPQLHVWHLQSCMRVKNWSLLTSTYRHHFVIRRSVVSTVNGLVQQQHASKPELVDKL